MLVHHAILKSLLKLCQSNVDVSAYAPVVGTIDIFTQMGKSSTLGPFGCHQAPSKYSHAEDEYTIDGFSKPGFLCYQAITNMVTKLKNSSARNFLLENVSVFDSDHDEVLLLRKKLSDLSELHVTSDFSSAISASNISTFVDQNTGETVTAYSSEFPATMMKK